MSMDARLLNPFVANTNNNATANTNPFAEENIAPTAGLYPTLPEVKGEEQKTQADSAKKTVGFFEQIKNLFSKKQVETAPVLTNTVTAPAVTEVAVTAEINTAPVAPKTEEERIEETATRLFKKSFAVDALTSGRNFIQKLFFSLFPYFDFNGYKAMKEDGVVALNKATDDLVNAVNALPISDKEANSRGVTTQKVHTTDAQRLEDIKLNDAAEAARKAFYAAFTKRCVALKLDTTDASAVQDHLKAVAYVFQTKVSTAMFNRMDRESDLFNEKVAEGMIDAFGSEDFTPSNYDQMVNDKAKQLNAIFTYTPVAIFEAALRQSVLKHNQAQIAELATEHKNLATAYGTQNSPEFLRLLADHSKEPNDKLGTLKAELAELIGTDGKGGSYDQLLLELEQAEQAYARAETAFRAQAQVIGKKVSGVSSLPKNALLNVEGISYSTEAVEQLKTLQKRVDTLTAELNTTEARIKAIIGTLPDADGNYNLDFNSEYGMAKDKVTLADVDAREEANELVKENERLQQFYEGLLVSKNTTFSMKRAPAPVALFAKNDNSLLKRSRHSKPISQRTFQALDLAVAY